jgi:acylphosphatase
LNIIRAHLYISGRVQGVFFRYETKHLAEKLAVAGWIRNLPDGRVEVVFEGDEENVQKLIRFCHRGPQYAKVEEVEVEFETPKRKDNIFTILY